MSALDDLIGDDPLRYGREERHARQKAQVERIAAQLGLRPEVLDDRHASLDLLTLAFTEDEVARAALVTKRLLAEWGTGTPRRLRLIDDA